MTDGLWYIYFLSISLQIEWKKSEFSPRFIISFLFKLTRTFEIPWNLLFTLCIDPSWLWSILNRTMVVDFFLSASVKWFPPEIN